MSWRPVGSHRLKFACHGFAVWNDREGCCYVLTHRAEGGIYHCVNIELNRLVIFGTCFHKYINYVREHRNVAAGILIFDL